jgi:hypothetical protein
MLTAVGTDVPSRLNVVNTTVCWFRNRSNVSTVAPLVVRPVNSETIALART